MQSGFGYSKISIFSCWVQQGNNPISHDISDSLAPMEGASGALLLKEHIWPPIVIANLFKGISRDHMQKFGDKFKNS